MLGGVPPSIDLHRHGGLAARMDSGSDLRITVPATNCQRTAITLGAAMPVPLRLVFIRGRRFGCSGLMAVFLLVPVFV